MKEKQRPAASVRIDPQQLAQQGESEIHSRNFAAAEKKLAEAARLLPDSSRVQHLLGVALHEQGNLDRAIACYRKAVKLNGNRSDAQRDLGAAYMDKRRYGDALGCYREAMRLDPVDALACEGAGAALREMGDIIAARKHFQRALWLRIKGRLRALFGLRPDGSVEQPAPDTALEAAGEDITAQARRAYEAGDLERAHTLCRQVVASQAGDARALHLLALICERMGRRDEAIVLATRAASASGADVEVHLTLARLLLAAGRPVDALERVALADRLEPGSAEVHARLAATMFALGQFEESCRAAERALEFDPACAEAHGTLGAVLGALGDYALAEQRSREALRIDPGNVRAYINLGAALKDQDRVDEARAAYDEALRLAPQDADLCVARGTLSLEVFGRTDEALQWYRQAAALRPGWERAEALQGLVLLLSGRYAEGWDRYEARKRNPADAELHARIEFPEWDGASLEGRTLLVYGEQGLGDEIMFASCLPDVLRRAKRCHVLCSQRLAGLFARSFPAANVVGWRGPKGSLESIQIPQADLKCVIGSLPRHLRRSRAEFPAHAGYLVADPLRVARWRERLEELDARIKVGLSWRGGLPRSGRRRRSLDLGRLEPLLRVPDVAWISLQYTDCRAEIEEFAQAARIRIHHWQEAIDDFEEHAALAAALDHRVSVCNTLAHLCGSLGVPAWVLTPYVPEWRYAMEGQTMLWYPSVRLYRQTRPGDWEEVVRRLGIDLRAMVAEFRVGRANLP